MDDTKSAPSEMVALMMLIRYYSASCLQLIDRIIAKLPPEVAFPQAFVSKDTAPPPTSSATPVASSSPPASPPAPAPTPPPAPPPVPAPTPQQPTAESVVTIPNAEPTTSLSLQYPAVRHKLTVAAQAGHSAEVKALLTRRDATKLSEVDPGQYQTLLQEVEMLLKEKEVDGND